MIRRLAQSLVDIARCAVGKSSRALQLVAVFVAANCLLGQQDALQNLVKRILLILTLDIDVMATTDDDHLFGPTTAPPRKASDNELFLHLMQGGLVGLDANVESEFDEWELTTKFGYASVELSAKGRDGYRVNVTFLDRMQECKEGICDPDSGYWNFQLQGCPRRAATYALEQLRRLCVGP